MDNLRDVSQFVATIKKSTTDDDGETEITLLVPEIYLGEIAKTLALRKIPIKVTIEPESHQLNEL